MSILKTAIVRIFTLSTLMAICGTGLALAEDKTKEEAARLLQAGKYQEACDVLETVEKKEYDPQLAFLKGQCRFGMLDYAASAFQYQIMLEHNTNLPRVRTELARTLAAMGKNKAAKEEYEKVLSGDIPDSVRRNVTGQMQRIDDRRRSGGVLSLGFMYDSNVNAAPSDPNIQAFGLPFVLDRESTEKSDNALVGSASFGKYFDMLVGDDWRFDVYGNFVKYSSLNEFDSYSLGMSTGPNFYSNSQIYLPLGVSTSWENGHRATQTASFSPSLNKALSQKLRVSGQLYFQYYDDLRSSNESNGWSKGINTNMQYSVNQRNMLELGASVLDNDANELSYNIFVSKTVSAGWYTAFNNNVKFSFQMSYTRVNFNSDDPVDSGVVRDDDRYAANVNISKDVNIGTTLITPVLALTWAKNESNIDRRDYEQENVIFQIRKQF